MILRRRIGGYLCLVVLSLANILLFPNVASALDGIVYVISGGPFDTGESPTDQYSLFLKGVREQASHSDLYLARAHNSKQNEICSDILKHKKDHPEAKIAIAGHSYGGDAAVWTAKCLNDQNITVDFLLTLDTVPRTGSSDSILVPENVKFNFHVYQRFDGMIRGSGPNRRKDGSSRGIYAYKQNFGSAPVSAHLSVLKHINAFAVGYKLVAAVLLGADDAGSLRAVEPELAKYFKSFPAL